MKQFIKDLLREDSKVSTTRLMSLMCVISAIIIVILGLYLGKELTGLATISGTFLGPAFAAKVFQKNMENK